MLTWIILLALAWPTLWVLRVLLTVRLLLGIEFRRETVVPHATEAISPHLREAAQPYVPALETAGFHVLGGWRVERSADGPLDGFAVVLARAGTPAGALLQTCREAERAGECWASLRTTAASGSEIVTTTYVPEELVSSATGIVREPVRSASVSALLERHLVRIAAVASEAWVCADISSAVLRETMRWTRRGAVDVLAFGSTAAAKMLGSPRDNDESLTWRLPPL